MAVPVPLRERLPYGATHLYGVYVLWSRVPEFWPLALGEVSDETTAMKPALLLAS
jgi:hypothetical protein